MPLITRLHGAVDAVSSVDGGDCGQSTCDVFFAFHLLGAALVFGGGADVRRGFRGAVNLFVVTTAVALTDFAMVVASRELGTCAAIAASAVSIAILDVAGWFIAVRRAVIFIACCCVGGAWRAAAVAVAVGGFVHIVAFAVTGWGVVACAMSAGT